MKVKGIVLALIAVFALKLQGQVFTNPLPCLNSGSVLNGVTNKSHIPMRAPVAPAYVREADLMWEKWIWRTIDLRQKMNLPLYYPLEPSNGYASLISIMYCGIADGKLTAYSSIDDEFSTAMTKDEVFKIGFRADTVMVPDLENPDIEVPTVVTTTLSCKDIVEYRLKEVWYFDRQRSEFLPRIIGICPVRNVYSADGELKGTQELFWLYFPELRNVLANYQYCNRFNNTGPLSYDDVFTKRIFSSYIYKESNPYDRKITDYTAGMDAQLESERIKQDMINQEQDLWDW